VRPSSTTPSANAQAAVELLQALDDHPARTRPQRGRDLILPGDVVTDVDPHDASRRHREALEAHRLAGSRIGLEARVDDGVGGERVEQHDHLTGVTRGRARGQVPDRRGGRCAGADIQAVGTGDAVLDGHRATLGLDECRHQRRGQEVPEPQLDAVACR
jgi:hypothetical protein